MDFFLLAPNLLVLENIYNFMIIAKMERKWNQYLLKDLVLSKC